MTSISSSNILKHLLRHKFNPTNCFRVMIFWTKNLWFFHTFFQKLNTITCQLMHSPFTWDANNKQTLPVDKSHQGMSRFAYPVQFRSCYIVFVRIILCLSNRNDWLSSTNQPAEWRRGSISAFLLRWNEINIRPWLHSVWCPAMRYNECHKTIQFWSSSRVCVWCLHSLVFPSH